MAHRLVALAAAAIAACEAVAPLARAPRGFNSWDSWASGELGNANETEVLAAASYMAANLLPWGWDTVVIDEGWYWNGSSESIDAYGRPYPRTDMYPSAADGTGLRHIADQVHAMGLKLGVWTLRGIPNAAVAANSPIANSSFRAADAVGPASLNCEWSSHTAATNAPSAAATAYYLSVAEWYQRMGVDYVKVDCLWPTQPSLPQHTGEIVAISTAIQGRGLTLSMSPGGYVSLTNATFVSSGSVATAYR